jgi:hypothetical protein
VLGWAARAGARTVLVRAAAMAGPETTPRIGSLAELPDLLRSQEAEAVAM